MYLVKTPSVLRPLARDLTWKIETSNKEVYLTFDDGPTPIVTEKVLELLRIYGAKATFFCLGKNVEAHPEIYEKILADGHTTGNHSYNHPDGWKTSTITYLKNIILGKRSINSRLYRPPYGRITLQQIHAVKKKYRIIMWDVLSGDFDRDITKEECLQNVINNTDAGSIVVFHDSEKAKSNMLFALEESLKYFHAEGYILRAIT
jgi:peptidoglycan-N-acetylglucosamine deacetylase